MKFNINDYVSVTLTEVGATIYNDYYAPFIAERPEYYTWWVEKKASDVLKDQLWSIMQKFGPHVGLGFASPFEDCVIDI